MTSSNFGFAHLVPYGRHCIDDDDVAAVAAVLRGDWLTTGPTVDAFEAAFARAVGARHAVSCSSGTAGLHLAAMAFELGASDWLVVPAVTFLATANAARYVGAEALFADVDPDTGLLRPEDVAAALDRMPEARVRAVAPVHLAGQCADVATIRREFAEPRGWRIVEDACHVLGGSQRDGTGAMRLVGSCPDSDMAMFSTHPVKTIASGEGGVLTTNDGALADRLRILRNHGMTRDPARFQNAEMAEDGEGNVNPWYYEMQEVGYNYRLSDIHAALGLSQLAKFNRFVAQRRRLRQRYVAQLRPLAPLVRPLPEVPASEPCWHLSVVLIDFAALGKTRAQVMRALRDRNVGTQVHYIPVHRQPYYRRRYGDLHLPGADAYYARCLSLPLFPTMEDADVDRVVAILAEVLGLG